MDSFFKKHASKLTKSNEVSKKRKWINTLIGFGLALATTSLLSILIGNVDSFWSNTILTFISSIAASSIFHFSDSLIKRSTYRKGLQKKNNLKSYDEKAISTIMLKVGFRKQIIVLCILLIVGIIGMLTKNVQLLILTLVFIALVLIRNRLTDFRIQKGFFGNNEREAKELMRFIFQQKGKIDFNDKDGNAKTLNPVIASSEEFEITLESGLVLKPNSI